MYVSVVCSRGSKWSTAVCRGSVRLRGWEWQWNRVPWRRRNKVSVSGRWELVWRNCSWPDGILSSQLRQSHCCSFIALTSWLLHSAELTLCVFFCTTCMSDDFSVSTIWFYECVYFLIVRGHSLIYIVMLHDVLLSFQWEMLLLNGMDKISELTPHVACTFCSLCASMYKN